jgi:Replication-relaxation
MTTAFDTRRLAEAGVRLGELTIEWGRRREPRPPCRLTQRDRRLLSFLHDFGYATTTILALLFWGECRSAAFDRLKLLHDAGFVDKLRPRVARRDGSREWIYRLTTFGWEVILDAGMAADGEDYIPAHLTSISYVEHDVQVSALITRLACIAAQAAGTVGPIIDAAPFGMLGPRSGVIDVRRERCPPNPSKASELGEREVHVERSLPGLLKPDATLVGMTRDGDRMAVMFEFDRTRRASKQVQRLRHYDYFLSAGWRDTRYATLDLEPAVLVVCSDSRQVPSFLRAADGALTAWIAQPHEDRHQGEYAAREQVGITCREDLLRGDWALSQVSKVPASARSKSASDKLQHESRDALPLDRLFAEQLREDLPGSTR